MRRGGERNGHDEPVGDLVGAAEKRSPEHEPLVEAKDVAKYLGATESWVKDQVRSRVPKERQLPHYKLGAGKGTYLRFRLSRIDLWLEAREQGFRCLAR